MNIKYATIGLISGYLAGYLQDYFTENTNPISKSTIFTTNPTQTTRI